MRQLAILGIVLSVIGLWFIIRPPTFAHQENAFKIGGLQATFEERRPVPQWIGGTALGAGLVLVVIGLRKR